VPQDLARCFSWLRIIEVYHDYDYDYDAKLNNTRMNDVLRTNQPPPVTLHVCRESREETLKRYMPVGKVGIERNTLDFCYAFFDPSKDTVFVPYTDSELRGNTQNKLMAGDIYSNGALNKLQYYAIDTLVWDQHGTRRDYMTFFRNLKELTIVFHEEDLDGDVEIYIWNHEHWRMKSNEIAFHEPDDFDSRNDAEYWTERLDDYKEGDMEVCKKKPRNYVWHGPKYKFKIMSTRWQEMLLQF
jgi:hypothetical protein